MIIQTAQLDLIPVEPSDADTILSGKRSSDWAIDYPTEGDVVIARLVAERSARRTDAYVPHKIILRVSGQVIGGCGFLGPPNSSGSVEIGYGLAPSHRGKGIATEAVRGLVEQAWKDRVVKQVFAIADDENEPSQGVLRRAGFQHVDSDGNQLRWEVHRQSGTSLDPIPRT
jgi:RimJ/RimL family protein N-acetyltransferase